MYLDLKTAIVHLVLRSNQTASDLVDLGDNHLPLLRKATEASLGRHLYSLPLVYNHGKSGVSTDSTLAYPYSDPSDLG